METLKSDPNKKLLDMRKEASFVALRSKRKRHERGVLMARERIEKLVDEGSF
jgi:acetyl-CoA carboxylase carboxyltransferase component